MPFYCPGIKRIRKEYCDLWGKNNRRAIGGNKQLKSFSSSSLANGSFGESLTGLAAQRSWLKTGSAVYFGYLALGFLLIGTVLRVGQYAMGAALWHDELALARNIVEKPLRELLVTPLDYTQVAPTGFLLLEKAAITALGNNEYALRFLPLLCALISLPLFADVARRALAPGAALLALALFSLSPTLIGFGSQVKQYSMDVAMALAMTMLTLRWWERRVTSRGVSDTAFLGVAGFVAVWFSHTAVLVLIALGGALLLEADLSTGPRHLVSLIPIGILWSGGSLAMLAFGTHHERRDVCLYAGILGRRIHARINAVESGVAMALAGVPRLFSKPTLVSACLRVAVLLMLVGAVALIRRRRWPALVILAPLGVTLAASAAHQYPFGDRVSLFLLPFILLLLVEGIDRVRQAARPAWRPLGAIVVALAMLLATYPLYAFYPLYPKQAMPEVLAYVQTRRQPQDAIYVYHGAGHAVGYYGAALRIAAAGGGTRQLR